MSYILDALRKAEAQRERRLAPGLHDRPLGNGGDTSAASGSMPWVAGGGLALGVVAIGLLAWVLAGRSPGPAAVPGPAAPAVAAVPAPAPATLPAVAAPAVQPAPPNPAVAAVVLPAPAPAAAQPPAAAPAAAPSASRALAAASAVPSAMASAPAVARQAEPATAPPSGAPRVSISGGVWSSEPAQRMLVANGQVVNEGGEVAPGLTLEQVRQGNRAVLVWQGQRYLVGW